MKQKGRTVAKQYQIEITKLNSYDIEGTIDIDGVLHLVTADFKIDWDNDVPMPQIETVYMLVMNHWIKLNSDRLNIYELEEEVYQRGNVLDWNADKLASYMDHDFNEER